MSFCIYIASDKPLLESDYLWPQGYKKQPPVGSVQKRNNPRLVTEVL